MGENGMEKLAGSRTSPPTASAQTTHPRGAHAPRRSRPCRHPRARPPGPQLPPWTPAGVKCGGVGGWGRVCIGVDKQARVGARWPADGRRLPWRSPTHTGRPCLLLGGGQPLFAQGLESGVCGKGCRWRRAGPWARAVRLYLATAPALVPTPAAPPAHPTHQFPRSTHPIRTTPPLSHANLPTNTHPRPSPPRRAQP